MTPMLEVMSSIKPHERLYVQIVAVSFRPSSFLSGQLTFGEGPSWNKPLKEAIDKMMNRDPETRLPKGKVKDDGDDESDKVNVALTSGEKDTISAMERHSTKYAYKTAIRWIYANKQGGFNSDLINPVIRMFSQFDSGVNALGIRWRTDFDYKDIIPGGKKKALAALKTQELKEYRRRIYYPKSGGDPYKIFTAEELATIFHLPGGVALTPTLDRVPSTRGEAPSNLPTGEMNE